MERKLKEFMEKDIIELLKEIGNKLGEEVIIFMIGGGNMSLKKIKPITRDIDLVLLTKKEYETLKKVLVGLGYDCREESFVEDFYRTPIIVFFKDDVRIDVFIKDVGNQIELTKEMQERSKEYDKFGNLTVKLVSNEDIFLFKSITDREKDVDDCMTLVNEDLNWEKIKGELHRQEKRALWRFWVYEQLCRIRNKYGEIIYENFFNYIWGLVKEKWDEKPKDFMEDIKDERFEKEDVLKK